MGDLNSAYQALKVSVAKDSHHAESLNNLGVFLEMVFMILTMTRCWK